MSCDVVEAMERVGEWVVRRWSDEKVGDWAEINVSKSLFYRTPAFFDEGSRRSCSQSSWRELVPHCEPDNSCCHLPWHFLDGYEPFERCKYSLPESCVQRGLNRWTSCRPPSLRNRLEGFRLEKRNLHRLNIHLFRLSIMGPRLPWASYQIWHSLYPAMWEIGAI